MEIDSFYHSLINLDFLYNVVGINGIVRFVVGRNGNGNKLSSPFDDIRRSFGRLNVPIME